MLLQTHEIDVVNYYTILTCTSRAIVLKMVRKVTYIPPIIMNWSGQIVLVMLSLMAFPVDTCIFVTLIVQAQFDKNRIYKTIVNLIVLYIHKTYKIVTNLLLIYLKLKPRECNRTYFIFNI